MKTFIILNGTELKVTEQKNIGYAREVAIGISDHSKRIEVFEVASITTEALDILKDLPPKKVNNKQNQWNI